MKVHFKLYGIQFSSVGSNFRNSSHSRYCVAGLGGGERHLRRRGRDGDGRRGEQQVSCDWWRPGHVTTCSPVIGPCRSDRQQFNRRNHMAADENQPPGSSGSRSAASRESRNSVSDATAGMVTQYPNTNNSVFTSNTIKGTLSASIRHTSLQNDVYGGVEP